MAKNDFYSGKPRTWLSIDFAECAWCQIVKSTDEDEIQALLSQGYKKKVTENKTTKQTVVSYRRYYKSVSGYLVGLSIKDGPFGQVLEITLEDETESNVLNVNLFSQTGGLTGYAVDFIRHLPSIPLDEKICIGLNRKLKNESGRPVQIFTVLYEERTTSKGNELMKRGVEKDSMPALEPYTLAGKTKYNSTKRDTYLCNILDEYIKKVETEHIKVGEKSPYVPEEHQITVQGSTMKSAVEEPPASYTAVQGNTSFTSDVEDLPF